MMRLSLCEMFIFPFFSCSTSCMGPAVMPVDNNNNNNNNWSCCNAVMPVGRNLQIPGKVRRQEGRPECRPGLKAARPSLSGQTRLPAAGWSNTVLIAWKYHPHTHTNTKIHNYQIKPLLSGQTRHPAE